MSDPRGILRYTLDVTNEADLLVKASDISYAWFGDLSEIDMTYRAEAQNAYNGLGEITATYFHANVTAVRQ